MVKHRWPDILGLVGWASLLFLVAIPWGIPHIVPASWWYDVRDVRVDSETTYVTLDRTVQGLWFDDTRLVDKDSNPCPAPSDTCHETQAWTGNVHVTIRQVGVSSETGEMIDDGRLRSSCPGMRYGISYLAGQTYPKTVRATGKPRTLAWFMDSPPNAGCVLVPGSYVADFTWSRTFMGFKLRTSKSSNIFTMSRRLEMVGPENAP